MANSKEVKSVFRDVLSDNVREALNSFSTMRQLFYDNEKDIPYTWPLFQPETIHILHKSLFSSLITSIGRLMDKDNRSVSIPTAMGILRDYVPTAQHASDLWRYDFSNWKYDFEKKDIELVEASEAEHAKLIENYLSEIPEFVKLYESLLDSYEPIKKWRDKHIAHADIKHSDGSKSLNGVPRKHLIDFLNQLETLVSRLCGQLYQTSIDTSTDCADRCSNNLIDLAYTHQLARVLSSHIEQFSESKDADYILFTTQYACGWQSPEGIDLINRALKKREDIKNEYLSIHGEVNSHAIDEHYQ